MTLTLMRPLTLLHLKPLVLGNLPDRDVHDLHYLYELHHRRSKCLLLEREGHSARKTTPGERRAHQRGRRHYENKI
jgi:hypothetical protein